MPKLFDTWDLGEAPQPDPLNRNFKGVNRREAARARDFDALLTKMTEIDNARSR